MAASVFGESDNIKHAVEAINELPQERLPAMLNRIATRILVVDQDPFTTEEKNNLAEALQLESKLTELILDTLGFIFETTAYHQLKPNGLMKNLALVGFTQETAEAIVKTWQAQGAAIVTQLRGRAFYHRSLVRTKTETRVQLATDKQDRRAKCTGVLHLDIAQEGQVNPLTLEMDHAQLSEFFNKLEIVQQQLDQMA
eukprot:m.8671 g.8671  ORF g.8671 m.8671 type:complete len:198 (+) comp9241_c0_seq2:2-595(+)